MRIYVVIVLALLSVSCAQVMPPTHTLITSSPPGATVYMGRYKTHLRNTQKTTPYREEFDYATSYWDAMYFQVKKAGFQDSDIVHVAQQQGQRNLHFELIPRYARTPIPKDNAPETPPVKVLSYASRIETATATAPKPVVTTPAPIVEPEIIVAPTPTIAEPQPNLEPLIGSEAEQAFLDVLPSAKQTPFSALAAQFDVTYDRAEERFTLSHKSNESATPKGQTPIQAYIAYQPHTPTLFIKLHYKGRAWLNVHSVLARLVRPRALANTVYYPDSSRVLNLTAHQWDWDFKQATAVDIDFLNQMLSSPHTALRFEGKQGAAERTLTKAHKTQIQQILALYTALLSE